MAGLVHLIVDNYNEIFESSNKAVDEWFLMNSLVPIIGIVAVYLLFVLKIGPNYMSQRKPFDLKNVIIPYNGALVLFSCYICLFAVQSGTFNYCLSSVCVKPFAEDYVIATNRGTYWYFCSKIVELLDTIFFVLRKKQNQISFLHVYHHSNMVIVSWLYVKYVPVEQGIVPGITNCFVHIVMYLYYFLAAFGPQMQKYLWWKRYITKLQLAQFILIFIYVLLQVVNNCNPSKVSVLLLLFQAMTFFYLFKEFYSKSYSKNQVTQNNNKLK